MKKPSATPRPGSAAAENPSREVGLSEIAFDGRFLRVNDELCRMLDRTGRELLALTVEDVTHREDYPVCRAALARLAQTGAPASIDKRYLLPDGTAVWANSSLVRLRGGDGSPDVALIVTSDITARKLAESQLASIRESLERSVAARTADLDRANRSLRAEIEERGRMQLARQELLRQLDAAQEDERRHLSRDLHDQVGQHLASLLLGLNSLAPSLPPGEPRRTLDTLLATAETVWREIHDLAAALRPTALDDLGLLSTLAEYAREWAERAKIELVFHSAGLEEARLPPPLENTLYRIACETLNNVLKHARARRVGIILERDATHVRMIIEDDGVGFSPPAAGRPGAPGRIGLIGMHERAQLHGGQVIVESRPGGGTTVFTRLPLPSPSPRPGKRRHRSSAVGSTSTNSRRSGPPPPPVA